MCGVKDDTQHPHVNTIKNAQNNPKRQIMKMHSESGQNVYLIFIDRLGGGNSDRPDDRSLWTIERFLEELKQVRKVLQLHEAHILGQPWGTMLAVDYMLTKGPHGVTSMILSGPCLNTAHWSADQEAYLLEFLRLSSKSFRKGRHPETSVRLNIKRR